MRLKSRLCVFISIHGHRHAHLFLSVLFFTPSLYFFLKSFFHLFLIPAVPDENSMEDTLCNSSFGSMVSLDYVTPDTGYEPNDIELADINERNLATSSVIYFQDILEDTAVCLLYGNIGILYCTCGHFLLKEGGANQQFISYTMDFLRVPQYVICKGNISCTSYSRTFYDTQMVTANCVHPHAQLEQAGPHCEQLHEHHNAH